MNDQKKKEQHNGRGRQSLFIKGQIANETFINFRLGFASRMVSVTVAQFCHYSNKAGIGSM